MSSTPPPVNGGDELPPTVVILHIPPVSKFASTLRVVAASLGADAGFSVDDIDDLRLAMSEVFTSMVDHDHTVDVPVAPLVVSIDTVGPGLAVTFTAASRNGTDGVGAKASIVLDNLASSIIRSAVDEVEIRNGSVRLVKFGTHLPAEDPLAR